MEEDEEAMLELELTAGAGNDEDVDDDSLMMALGEDDSLFGSEAPDGQQAAPLCSTPIKKARLVRGESLTDFLSQELDDGLAPTASPASTSEPHSQPISESSNGVNTTKSGEEGCSEAVSTQQEDSGSDTAPVEPTEATAAGDEDADEAWKSQAEPEGDANEGGHESDDMVMEDEGEQEGETADGDATVSSSGPGGSNGDSDGGDSDGDDAGGDGGDGDSDNDAGVSDDEMGGSDDVEMGDTEDDAADEAEQTVDESEDNAQCVCVTLTENGEDGEGEGEGGEAGEELVVFQDRPELYSSPLSAFMQALQEELSMANDIVLEFQGLSLKFYTNLPFVEKLSLYDLAFLHSKLNMEGCLTAELTEESTNFLARYNELVALSQAEPEAEEVLGKRSIGTEDDEGEGAPQQPKRRRS